MVVQKHDKEYVFVVQSFTCLYLDLLARGSTETRKRKSIRSPAFYVSISGPSGRGSTKHENGMSVQKEPAVPEVLKAQYV